jgi:hypothetical protein
MMALSVEVMASSLASHESMMTNSIVDSILLLPVHHLMMNSRSHLPMSTPSHWIHTNRHPTHGVRPMMVQEKVNSMN